ncbi:MAG: hypothetical protein ACREIQ_08830 [Nitrospiria bacterium]
MTADKPSSHKNFLEPDPVIERYKRDIDRTLLRENLKLTVEERFWKLMRLQSFAEELRRAAGRPKDLEAIAELEALREEHDRPR